MKFTIERTQLLKSLYYINNLLSNRPTLSILNNLLIQVNNKTLLLTGTDLEVELISIINLTKLCEDGSITVSARKFFDICRGLSNDSEIKISLERNRLLIKCDRSRFSLSTLPANDFPNLDDWQSKIEFELPQIILKRLIETTQFSMAYQDVRYYLNGMLFETKNYQLSTVTTDGHRLSICSLNIDKKLLAHSVIVPRKGVIEFMRLLNNNYELLKLQIGNNNIRAYINNFIFTSKLIDGIFPDYQRVFPKNSDKILTANCNKLKQAFSRAAILSNEKFHGIKLYISKNQLKITTNNPDQEESEEIIDVNYNNETIEINFNVNYILDVLNTIKCEKVQLLLTDSNSSMQIRDIINNDSLYIIMPMRL